MRVRPTAPTCNWMSIDDGGTTWILRSRMRAPRLPVAEYAGPDVSPDTPALVCAYTALVSTAHFLTVSLAELSRNYRVIAYDRRGCGGSNDAADGSYDLAAQVADLQAVIEHVGAPANLLAR